MHYKFILEDKSSTVKTEMKTLRQISNDLKIDYFQIRSIYLESKKPKKYLHPITKQLCDKYKIYDNPNVFNVAH